MQEIDDAYLELILEPIRRCAEYRPRFGHGKRGGGFTLTQFQALHRADQFYNWFGLDHPLMYAAHRAAGGMTSIYRQVGLGCERLFRAILRDALGLTDEDVVWSYDVLLPTGRRRTLSLDARVPLSRIADTHKRQRFYLWMRDSANQLGVDRRVLDTLDGAVFEVRQGYKSKDAKRQNADITNAATAYTRAYLPCIAVFSTQFDTDLLFRYTREKWVVMTGAVDSMNPLNSTYDFMRDVVGYDLADFFARHSANVRQAIEQVLAVLLAPEDV